jgi:uncharacterized protein YndB with AHSA1/START domain
VRDAVTVHMSAPPEAIWSVVTDVPRIGRFSPETFEAEWLDGATGRGPVYWTKCEVVACEPEREFGFAVLTGGRPVNTWRYRLEPAGDGTDVTESFELADTAPLRLYWLLLGWARGRTNREGMRTTLERMKAEVEAAAPS